MPAATSSPHATYVAHLAKGELAYQWSPEAGRAVFFPRLICPYTGSDKLEWRIASGLGTVYSTTVVHGVDGSSYNVALIDCDEGFRLMSRVEGVEPAHVALGMRVKFRAHAPGGDAEPVPVFSAVTDAKPAPAPVAPYIVMPSRSEAGLERGVRPSSVSPNPISARWRRVSHPST